MLAMILALCLCIPLPQDDEFKPLPSDPELRHKMKVRILDKIRSEDQPKSAWGAYQAGKFGLKEYVPALLELVERENNRPPEASPLTKKAALDALVRLDADVPAELLTSRIAEEHYSETMILLARNKEENQEDLLCFMDRLPIHGKHWWVAAVYLTSVKPPGLAQRLLQGLQFELTIFVYEDLKPRRRGARLGPGMVRSRSKVSEYDPYPPWSRYSFTIASQKFQDKRIVVEYMRHESPQRPQIDCTADEMLTSYKVRRCLEALLESSLTEYPLTQTAYIRWKEEQDYLEKSGTAIEKTKDTFRSMLCLMIAKELITKEEGFKMDPPIRVKVEDRRKKPSAELPQIDGTEPGTLPPR